jgi:hypothetical protein
LNTEPDWDARELHRRRRAFVTQRREWHPMVLSTTLIFTATWLAGWLFSAVLLRAGLLSMPLRYAIAFALSYGVFFACVRLWSDFVRRDRGSTGLDGLEAPPLDGDGCAVLLAVALAAWLVAGVFWLSGGFTALLEAAFEVVFAGTLVRRLGRTQVLGSWARTLLAGTWMHALAVLVVLVAVAAWLQAEVPQAHTFAQGVAGLRR